MKDVDIGILRQSNLPLKIVKFIILVKMVEVYLYIKRPATLYLATVGFNIVVIKVVTVVEVYIGILRPATLPLAIV